MDILPYIISSLLGIAGVAAGYFFGRKNSADQAHLIIESSEAEAKKLIENAKRESENIKKNNLIEAKEQVLKLQSQFENENRQRESKLIHKEAEFKNRQNQLNQKTETVSRKEKELENQIKQYNQLKEILDKKKEDIDQHLDKLQAELEAVSGMSKEEAKKQLVEAVRAKVESDALRQAKVIHDETINKANKEAKKIIIQTIQRTASEYAIENTVSVFNLESDDQKGQIIGREGRNIRAIEAATGCELVIDDTPEAIIISGYDPIRREVARLSLQRLVSDGRIHPARIEEVVQKTTKQLEEHIIEIGERTVLDLNIQGLHPELIRYVGRMRFRSSYGQNLLMHSREVANLCATMAAELGLNPKLAKRAGLLHDIGKVPDEESELSHALLGMKICEKYGEHPAVCNAVGAHHDEIEMKYVISPIIQACDSISGARPGARREVIESYMQRISDLENLASSYKGVEKAYAIQAGKELRVIVESDKMSDKESDELSYEIAQKIQNDMTYPGQIKVTVIREKRAVNVAK